jgi:ribosomal protein S18
MSQENNNTTSMEQNKEKRSFNDKKRFNKRQDDGDSGHSNQITILDVSSGDPYDVFDENGEVVLSSKARQMIKNQVNRVYNRPVQKKFSVKKFQTVDINYKNPALLTQFLSPMGLIMGPRKTGFSKKESNILSNQIKIARIMAILPFPHQKSHG